LEATRKKEDWLLSRGRSRKLPTNQGGERTIGKKVCVSTGNQRSRRRNLSKKKLSEKMGCPVETAVRSTARKPNRERKKKRRKSKTTRSCI